MSKVRILVGYHKPAKLLKSDVFTPIHLGRALGTDMSKDGKMSEADLRWMHGNMIGDDTGDNISPLNRYVNEMTGLYWAWKNYAALGNPEYIGFMHYRRHLMLNPKFGNVNYPWSVRLASRMTRRYMEDLWLSDDRVLDLLSDGVDIVCTKPFGTDDSILDNFARLTPGGHREMVLRTIETCGRIHPECAEAVSGWFNGRQNIWYNCFVMRKGLFFEYMEWLFPVLFELHQTNDYTNASMASMREVGYMAERLLGAWIGWKTRQNPGIRVRHCNISFITDADGIAEKPRKRCDGEISVVMATDSNYAPYLAATVASLCAHTSQGRQYTVYILADDGIAGGYADRLLALETGNVKIRFVDMTSDYDDAGDLLFASRHVTRATYGRCFIPEVFADFDKVIYCDCDGVFLDDPAKLYDVDIEGRMLAAVRDAYIVHMQSQPCHARYFSDILGIERLADYFNAGFLLFNIPECRRNGVTRKCLEKLREVREPLLHDQEMLNCVCQGGVVFLDWNWNVLNQAHAEKLDMVGILSATEYVRYLDATSHPKFLHFTGIKPWIKPALPNADLFWRYARMTPFYEETVYRNAFLMYRRLIEDRCSIWKLRIAYFRYRLLSKLMLGKERRRKYRDKKRRTRARLKAVYDFF